MAFETIALAVEEGLATITLNRPDRLNAMNRQMFRELRQAIERVAADPAGRLLVVTGAGDRAFAAGADIREFLELDPAAAVEYSRGAQRTLGALETLSKPTIAAVNGFALGGGCELMMACDIVYAADTARIGQPEVSLGLIPAAGGTQRLPRLVGKQRAKELAMTGEVLSAEQALRLGLVCRVVPAAELALEVRALCQRLLSKSDVALRLVKEAIDAGCQLTAAAGLEVEAQGFGRCFRSDDHREGIRAFLEKRQPRFAGS